MSPELAISLWTLALLSTLAGFAFVSELRRRRVDREVSVDRIFRCSQCGLVYTDDAKVDRSRCPGCGRTNVPFQF